MMQKLRTFTVVFVPILTLALGWQLGMRSQATALSELQERLALQFRGGTGSTVQDPEQDVDIALLWTTWRILLKNYIAPEKLEPKALLFGAVRGMVHAVDDPYTLFMTPEENDEFRRALSGDLEGIGAELADRDGAVIIVVPLRGSPAEKAGLRAGDRILSVDGQTVDGQTLQEVVMRVRGPKGTKVTIELARGTPPELKTIAIVRESIHIPSAEWRVEDAASGKIGYLAINQFGDGTVGEVETALADLLRSPIKGIVLDLRNNGGGYLDGAVDVVSLFLDKGKVVSVARREGQPTVHYVHPGKRKTELPIVVLINGGSASASEIAAGALQDLDRATVMGTQSFGKGTVQEVIDLPGGSSVRVTVARWLTPDGHDLSKQGVTPDMLVEQPEDATATNDAQLKAALEFLRSGKRPPLPTAKASPVR